jgi:acetoin utilization deacetylase AcuC-like enzyme
MTYLAAWLAVGGCLKGLDAVISSRCDACFALIRPPGHHALPDRAGGFCIFNNLGITARHAVNTYGLRRILIIDWDVHHGNGLNDLFYENQEVLYFSTHDPLLYPFTGDWDETGRGRGAGYTVNIPIGRTLEDEGFLYLYAEVLGALFERYRPEIVLVVAGFDGVESDPVGRSLLSVRTFGRLTTLIVSLAKRTDNPHLLFALEGGYNLRTLSESVKEVLTALFHEDVDEVPSFEGSAEAVKLMKKAKRIHSRYRVWAG